MCYRYSHGRSQPVVDIYYVGNCNAGAGWMSIYLFTATNNIDS